MCLFESDMLGVRPVNRNSVLLQEDILSNLRLNIITGAHTQCQQDWRDIGYIPDYNKFYLIEDGEGWLKIGSRDYYPKPGQLVLMPANVLQSYSAISSRPFTKHWCHFTATIGGIGLFDLMELPHSVDVDDMVKLGGLFEAMLREHQSEGVAAGLRCRSILLELIACYLDAAHVRELHFAKAGALRDFNDVIAYIHSHMSEQFSVGDLAARLHYNTSYFTRMFRKYTGLAPIQYINRARMEKAKALLKTTELSVTEIASDTGFGDVFYFSKSFKSHTGFSPKDYRAL